MEYDTYDVGMNQVAAGEQSLLIATVPRTVILGGPTPASPETGFAAPERYRPLT